MKSRIFINQIVLPLLSIILLFPSLGFGGDQNNEKIKARLSLTYTNTNNQSPGLSAIVKTKIDRTYVGLSEANIHFYYQDSSEDNFIGSSLTDDKGEAVFEFSEKFIKILDTTNHYTFLAVLRDDPRVLDKEDAIEITKSKIEMTLEEIDSTRTITIFVSETSESGEAIPAEEVEVGIFVKRLFGLLPIAESEYSDEQGIISIDFPRDIPGDDEGNLLITAIVEDHDEYGTLTLTRNSSWGEQGSNRKALAVSGELWSPAANAPLYLVVTITSLVFGIWGFIVYIIFQVLKIRKLGLS